MLLDSKQGVYLNRSQYIEIENSSYLEMSSNFTTYARFMLTQYPPTYDADIILSKTTITSPVIGWVTFVHPSTFQYLFSARNSSTSTTLYGATHLSLNTTYNAVTTYDSNYHGRIYLDGNLDVEGDMVQIEPSTQRLRINCRYGVGKGMIVYKVAIWNRILTEGEIQNVEQIPSEGLVLYLDFTKPDYYTGDRTGLNSVTYNSIRWVHEQKNRMLGVEEL